MWNCLRIPKFSVFFFLFSTLRIFFLVSISLFLSPPLQIFQFSALLSTAGPDIYSSSFFFFRPRQLLRYSWDHPFHSPSPPVCVCVCVCVCALVKLLLQNTPEMEAVEWNPPAVLFLLRLTSPKRQRWPFISIQHWSPYFYSSGNVFIWQLHSTRS